VDLSHLSRVLAGADPVLVPESRGKDNCGRVRNCGPWKWGRPMEWVGLQEVDRGMACKNFSIHIAGGLLRGGYSERYRPLPKVHEERGFLL